MFQLVVAIALALAFPLLAMTRSDASPSDNVLRLLKEAKDDKQRSAEEILRRLGPIGPEVIAAFRLALLHEDPFFRRRAAAVLGIAGDTCPAQMSRLVDDESPGVRAAAMNALVLMGPASLQHLAVLLRERSPQTEQFKLAIDAVGRIGGVRAAGSICDILVRYRSGGFRHELAWQALQGMGPEVAVPVARLARYRQLQAGARLTLLAYDQSSLAAQFRGVLADEAVPARDKMDLASEAELVLGTDPLREELVRVLTDIESAEGMDAGLRGEATAMLRQMTLRPRKPLTARDVNREERDLILADRREESEQDRQRQQELDAARAARAAEELRGAALPMAAEEKKDLTEETPKPFKSDPAFDKEWIRRANREREAAFERQNREYKNQQERLLGEQTKPQRH